MGLCSVAGMLELKATLDFHIFEFLALLSVKPYKIAKIDEQFVNLGTTRWSDPLGSLVVPDGDLPKCPFGPHIERDAHQKAVNF